MDAPVSATAAAGAIGAGAVNGGGAYCTVGAEATDAAEEGPAGAGTEAEAPLEAGEVRDQTLGIGISPYIDPRTGLAVPEDGDGATEADNEGDGLNEELDPSLTSPNEDDEYGEIPEHETLHDPKD